MKHLIITQSEIADARRYLPFPRHNFETFAVPFDVTRRAVFISAHEMDVVAVQDPFHLLEFETRPLQPGNHEPMPPQWNLITPVVILADNPYNQRVLRRAVHRREYFREDYTETAGFRLDYT